MSDYEDLAKFAASVSISTGSARSAKQKRMDADRRKRAQEKAARSTNFYGRVSAQEPSLPKLKFMGDRNEDGPAR